MAGAMRDRINAMQLHDGGGRRKYITSEERERILEVAEQMDRHQRTLLLTLIYSGCRLSEALNLKTNHVEIEQRRLIFESLKKRRRGIYRAVPVPREVVDALDLVHGVREAARRGRDKKLWTLSRTSAWRVVRFAFAAAGIQGAQASPKGLRHGFGVQAVARGVPLNLVQKWLGHAQLSTTAIYADAMGEEELSIAAKMWSPEKNNPGTA